MARRSDPRRDCRHSSRGGATGGDVRQLLVKGQITGGVAQGLGQALMENAVYDPNSGQLLSATFMDYAMPRARDVPDVAIVDRSVPTRQNPLCVKGVGEAGTVGALSAVMSAVADALRPLGVRHLDMPATPDRSGAVSRCNLSRSLLRDLDLRRISRQGG